MPNINTVIFCKMIYRSKTKTFQKQRLEGSTSSTIYINILTCSDPVY